MRFRDRLQRFFRGRYGVDGLYYAMLISYCVISLIMCFPINKYVRLALSALQLLLIFFTFFRALSRDHAKRRKENEAFMKVFRPLRDFFLLQKNRIRDVKDFRYRKCPHCKAWLRLPKRKGEHPVVCPRCKERFTVKVRF